MKKTLKKLVALTSAVSLTALSVAGCGGSSQTSADAGKGTEQSQAAAETKTETADAAASQDTSDGTDYTQGDKITIKIAHVSQEGVPIDVASKKLGDMLNEKTGGRITVNVFPASALGNNTGVTGAASDGNSGNGYFVSSISGSIYRDNQAFGSSVSVPV